MKQVFIMPPKILSGIGALEKLGGCLPKEKKKALIVTDEMMCKIGNIAKVTAALESRGLAYEIYSGVNSEPNDLMVAEGVAHYRETGCDLLIAVGGGSPIDAAKAIGAMSVKAGKISDYQGVELKGKFPYLVAIPTTAGTGSEVTQFTIITDTENQSKLLLKGSALQPKLAVVDPMLTLTTPPKVTVATGLDALCHAIEAYTSRQVQPLAETFAISAIKRIYFNLKKVWKNGADESARLEMALGALEAGIAFNNSSVTLIHGMSRPIGALFHVPHGVSNAILLPSCLEFAIQGAPQRFAEIAKVIGVYKEGMSEMKAASELAREMKRFCSELEVPTLEELGVEREVFFSSLDKMIEDALASGSPDNTMRRPQEKDLERIYRELWKAA